MRAKCRSNKTMYLSFDEWGIWNEEERANRSAWTFDWSEKNAISEGSYSFADALLTGSIMMTLINNCDRVKIACQAQLLNHLSLINCAQNGPVWKQTIFYPFLHASLYGRGTALRPVVDAPCYSTDRWERVPALETAAVVDEEARRLTVLVLNRDTQTDIQTDFTFAGFRKLTGERLISYTCCDLKAVNSLKTPLNVVPKDLPVPEVSGENVTLTLPRASWTVLRLAF